MQNMILRCNYPFFLLCGVALASEQKS